MTEPKDADTETQEPVAKTKKRLRPKRNISPVVLTTEEAADYLGVIGERTLERWRLAGKGPIWVEIEGRIGYRIADLDAYLDGVSVHPSERQTG